MGAPTGANFPGHHMATMTQQVCTPASLPSHSLGLKGCLSAQLLLRGSLSLIASLRSPGHPRTSAHGWMQVSQSLRGCT